MIFSICFGIISLILIVGMIRLCLKPRHNLKDIILGVLLIDLLGDLINVLLETIDFD